MAGLPFMNDRDSLAMPFPEEVVMGWMLVLASLYWPAFLGILLGKSLTDFLVIWGVTAAALMILVIFHLWRHPVNVGEGSLRKWMRGISIEEIAAVILVLFHAYVTFRYMHIDDDDSVYIAAAATSLDTNTLLQYNPLSGMPLGTFNESDVARQVTSPLFVFYAAVCRIFDLRPVVFAHTWYPPILTVYFYISYAALGRELFCGDRKKTALFVLFSYIVNMTAYYSVYTGGTFLMIRSWQGKAQVVGAILPLILAYYLHAARVRDMKGIDILRLLILFQASALMTSMGVMLGSMASFLFSFVASIYAKNKNIFIRTCLCLALPVLIMVLYYVLNKRGGLL